VLVSKFRGRLAGEEATRAEESTFARLHSRIRIHDSVHVATPTTMHEKHARPAEQALGRRDEIHPRGTVAGCAERRTRVQSRAKQSGASSKSNVSMTIPVWVLVIFPNPIRTLRTTRPQSPQRAEDRFRARRRPQQLQAGWPLLPSRGFWRTWVMSCALW
jgi:hypothetical protein